MKLYVESDLVYTQKGSEFEDWREEHWVEIDKILRNHTVYFSRTLNNEFVQLTIRSQKISLPESKMGFLVCEVFDRFFYDVDMEHHGFELTGSDFCSSIGAIKRELK